METSSVVPLLLLGPNDYRLNKGTTRRECVLYGDVFVGPLLEGVRPEGNKGLMIKGCCSSLKREMGVRWSLVDG